VEVGVGEFVETDLRGDDNAVDEDGTLWSVAWMPTKRLPRERGPAGLLHAGPST
jgi:hypothetical protein